MDSPQGRRSPSKTEVAVVALLTSTEATAAEFIGVGPLARLSSWLALLFLLSTDLVESPRTPRELAP